MSVLVLDGVWASFLRLTTSRRAFPVPTPLPRHVALLRVVCEESNASGELVPDAVIPGKL